MLIDSTRTTARQKIEKRIVRTFILHFCGHENPKSKVYDYPVSKLMRRAREIVEEMHSLPIIANAVKYMLDK